jgi:hypothetical protein
MYKLLIIGAGRSSGSLIEYLLNQAATCNWQITLAYMDSRLAEEKLNKHPIGTASAQNLY